MRRLPLFLVAAVAAASLVACGGDDDSPAAGAPNTETTVAATATTAAPADDDKPLGPITLYSGRGEDLVQPVIDAFTAATGIEVEVRYGNSAEMALLIQEEGRNTPADVYYSQGAGFLGLLSGEGKLLPLPADVLDRVSDANLYSPKKDWVGVTGRARVVVYNTNVLSAGDIPQSLTALADPQWRGRIGWAPTNASFQDHVTALRTMLGEEATRAWLQGIIANEPVEYANNRAILDAVAAGEVHLGLTNHYYLYPLLKETPSLNLANKFYSDGDPGALVNIAGAGVLATSQNQKAAIELIRFLLSEDAQKRFSTANFELPVVADVEPDPALPRIDSLVLPAFDLNKLADLEGTVQMLTEVGAL